LVDDLPRRRLVEVDLLSGGFALLDNLLKIDGCSLGEALRSVEAVRRACLSCSASVASCSHVARSSASWRARCSAVCLARAFSSAASRACSATDLVASKSTLRRFNSARTGPQHPPALPAAETAPQRRKGLGQKSGETRRRPGAHI
jgi:hypothetical protein